jgi:hypothetical protein
MQASNQLRSIGTTISHPAARVQSSGIQTVVTSSTTSQSSHVGSNPQMSLKQGVCMLHILYDSEKVLILQVKIKCTACSRGQNHTCSASIEIHCYLSNLKIQNKLLLVPIPNHVTQSIPSHTI